MEVFQEEPHEKIIGRGLIDDMPSPGVREMVSSISGIFRVLV